MGTYCEYFVNFILTTAKSIVEEAKEKGRAALYRVSEFWRHSQYVHTEANQPLHRRVRHIILGVVAEHGDDGAVRSVLARHKSHRFQHQSGCVSFKTPLSKVNLYNPFESGGKGLSSRLSEICRRKFV